MDDRSERALAGIDLAGLGLEIGPSYSPLVPKASGARVEIVDHASQDELATKYHSWGLAADKIDQIEPVDHIWSGGSLAETIGASEKYDYIVASHFIEHTVDLIAFLQDCEVLLKAGGRLALVVPDKRYCFDLLKPLSSLGQIVDAHEFQTRFHPPSCQVDHVAYACTRGGLIAWGLGQPGDIALQFDDLRSAGDLIADAVKQHEYFDGHRWKFTPSSFALLVQDLRDLGYHSLAEVASAPTNGFEFYLTLAKGGHGAERHDRFELLRCTYAELTEVAGISTGARAMAAQLEESLRMARAEIESSALHFLAGDRPPSSTDDRLAKRPPAIVTYFLVRSDWAGQTAK